MRPSNPPFQIIFVLAILVLLIQSCVPARKYDEAQTRADRLDRDLKACEEKQEALSAQNEELTTSLSDAQKSVTDLGRDTADFGTRYRKISKLNNDLNNLYDELLTKNRELLDNTSSEKEQLSLELSQKQKELGEKDLALSEKEQELKDKERALNEQQASMQELRKGLEEREGDIQELQSMLNRQDSIMNALQGRIQEALLGFDDDDLTVEMIDGKVYVSVAEQLLFRSGSTSVDPKGKEALQKLGEVLQKNPDIEVMVEGHTDNVPMKSSCIKDNWDLSVLRATSIVRILQDKGVGPARILPAGRGEFFPKGTNETSEGRAINRRTEIILSPQLDELYQLFQD